MARDKTQKKEKTEPKEAELKILVADDSPDSIDQISSWILERWPEAEIHRAQTPEEAFAKAMDEKVENVVLDLDFVVPRVSGVAIARKILEARSAGKEL